ncbi:MAG: hypothetical protein AAFV07_09205 [Bacteroidota bacterium]
MERFGSTSSPIGAVPAEMTLPRRYRVYRLRKAIRTLGIIVVGLIGLLLFSFLLLFR